jgi:hypothetical protein
VRVAFDRPEVRNAFRPHTVDELYRVLDHARQTATVGCVVLTGNGPSPKDGGWAFCSGGDQRIRGKDGYRYTSDTPLMFLDRVVPDEDHVELAWLVTRTLWGDLQEDLRPEDASAAEELSRTLRKRLSQAHPWSLRMIAAVSRLSLRHPYAASLWAVSKKTTKTGSEHARTAA